MHTYIESQVWVCVCMYISVFVCVYVRVGIIVICI